MSIVRKAKSVEQVFKALEADMSGYAQATGLRCVQGCGECCKYPEIEATPLEFLPFAFYLLQEGRALETYEKLQQSELTGPICLLFAPGISGSTTGSCTQYAYRGLICRLFGYSMRTDKYGKRIPITCKIMKQNCPEAVKAAELLADSDTPGPTMRSYYFRLSSIDATLNEKHLPINKAIAKALETVLNYYAYRRLPRKKKPEN